MRDKKGRFVKGYRASPKTEFKKGLVPWIKNKTHSKEAKSKISALHKGKRRSPRTEFKKGNIPWNKNLTKKTDKRLNYDRPTTFKKGRKQSKKWYELMKGRTPWNKNLTGWLPKERHGNWHNGKSFELYGLEFNDKFKEQIRKRDGYKCQECCEFQGKLCDSKGRKYKLIVHHIDFNKKNNDSNNLISVCRQCHTKTQYNRLFWVEHFQAKISKL